MTRTIEVPGSGKPFKNNTTYCVGTGRMGLALQQEYIDHLKIVQESCTGRKEHPF
jgi:xylan 1,4-beta-xylosidase